MGDFTASKQPAFDRLNIPPFNLQDSLKLFDLTSFTFFIVSHFDRKILDHRPHLLVLYHSINNNLWTHVACFQDHFLSFNVSSRAPEKSEFRVIFNHLEMSTCIGISEVHFCKIRLEASMSC